MRRLRTVRRGFTDAIITAMGDQFDLEEGDLPDRVAQEAKSLIPEHLPYVA